MAFCYNSGGVLAEMRNSSICPIAPLFLLVEKKDKNIMNSVKL